MSRLTQADLFHPDLLTRSGTGSEAAGNFKQVLVTAKTALAEYHLEGGSASTLGHKQSWLLDQLLTRAWERFFTNTEDPASPLLIAAGGYGRQELNIESDIDLLLLLPESMVKSQLATAESFVRFCWDIGLKVGHTIQTLAECVTLASEDLSVITNMMETRLLRGDPKFFGAFQDALRDPRIWPAQIYFTRKLEEQQARHLHFGDTAYNLEPNIKESPGGLRDLHMISWVANRYFGTSDLAELLEHGFLTRSEYQSLIRGRNFLWRLRNGLHILSGRCEDRLLFDYQRDLARQLGYQDRSNQLAVEQMMQRYYRTAQRFELLNELSLQHFEEAILQSRKPRTRPLNRRFNRVGNFIEAAREDLFAQQPGAILELFHVLQRHPELSGVRASTIRQLRANLDRINTEYRSDPKNLEMFLNIFKHQVGLTHALRRMNAYGVLGAFFPEFGRIVGQMQHDLFHIFTVDAHSLFVVGNLRKLMMDKYGDEFPVLRTIIAKLNRRERLYLAALCHDIGKGSGKDHSMVGEKIASRLCKRLGMSEYDTGLVAWLVRNHLQMSWIAQKEDTSDPRVIDRFAELVGDQEHLDNLYLLTVADIRGTSPKVWNEWKGQLLSSLYTATSRRLRSGITASQGIAQRIEIRKKAIVNYLNETIPADAREDIWAQLDQEFFLRNGPETSAWLAQQVYRGRIQQLPLVAIRHRPEINAQQILVIAPESEKLLPHSTAALDHLGLGILDARIHQTLSGLALLLFVTQSPDKPDSAKTSWHREITEIRRLLLHPVDNYTPRSKNLPRAHKQFDVTTRVNFSDMPELGHTAMEVVSQDRPGLLYHVSLVLLECRVKLISAKVSTVGEKAEDTFFITDRDGRPVSTDRQRKQLERKICGYLQ